MNGLIHIYTGEGKGKTTAAIGLAVRMAGNESRVLFSQFLKDGSSGEILLLQQIEGIDCMVYPYKVDFIKRMNREELSITKQRQREYFRKIVQKAQKYDMLILDEFCPAYYYDMIDREKALEFLKNKPEKTEIVLTGRNADSELIALADYVSEIRKVKHPFDKGIRARRGIEF